MALALAPTGESVAAEEIRAVEEPARDAESIALLRGDDEALALNDADALSRGEALRVNGAVPDAVEKADVEGIEERVAGAVAKALKVAASEGKAERVGRAGVALAAALALASRDAALEAVAVTVLPSLEGVSALVSDVCRDATALGLLKEDCEAQGVADSVAVPAAEIDADGVAEGVTGALKVGEAVGETSAVREYTPVAEAGALGPLVPLALPGDGDDVALVGAVAPIEALLGKEAEGRVVALAASLIDTEEEGEEAKSGLCVGPAVLEVEEETVLELTADGVAGLESLDQRVAAGEADESPEALAVPVPSEDTVGAGIDPLGAAEVVEKSVGREDVEAPLDSLGEKERAGVRVAPGTEAELGELGLPEGEAAAVEAALPVLTG